MLKAFKFQHTSIMIDHDFSFFEGGQVLASSPPNDDHFTDKLSGTPTSTNSSSPSPSPSLSNNHSKVNSKEFIGQVHLQNQKF